MREKNQTMHGEPSEKPIGMQNEHTQLVYYATTSLWAEEPTKKTEKCYENFFPLTLMGQ